MTERKARATASAVKQEQRQDLSNERYREHDLYSRNG
jgi:hypothetical protein